MPALVDEVINSGCTYRRELKEVSNLIERRSLRHEARFRQTADDQRAMREGKDAADAWISNKCYGTPKQQEAVYPQPF